MLTMESTSNLDGIGNYKRQTKEWTPQKNNSYKSKIYTIKLTWKNPQRGNHPWKNGKVKLLIKKRKVTLSTIE